MLLQDDIIYAYDCTSNSFYRHTDNSNLLEVNEPNQYIIFYKKEHNSLSDFDTSDEEKDLILKGLENVSNPLDYKKYLDLLKNAKNILLCYKSDFHDLNSDVQKLVKKVHKELEYGKREVIDDYYS